MSLGSRIYEQRTAHKLSQVDLADRLEVSRQSISKWETDASVPELDKLVKMCEVFEVSMDWLTRGKEPAGPPIPAAGRFSVPFARIAGLFLLALGALSFFLLAAVTQKLNNSALLALPFWACGGLCFAIRKKRRLALGFGWVICVWSAWFLYLSYQGFINIFDYFMTPSYWDGPFIPLCILDHVLFFILFLLSIKEFAPAEEHSSARPSQKQL